MHTNQPAPNAYHPIPILDQATHFVRFQLRIGTLRVDIERSHTGMWVKVPGFDGYCICLDLAHPTPQLLIYDPADPDSDQPVALARFGPDQITLHADARGIAAIHPESYHP